MNERLSGAQIVCESLKREGVEVIFGFPGGAVLPFYDVLAQYPDLRHILVRHEQGAVFAADSYARASGKVGVCLATSGPGATNLVTGIAGAYLDSSRLVAITGQVASHLIGTDGFQEVDITGIVTPVTKWRKLVLDPKGLAPAIKKAFYLAQTGRPGPVLLDIPTDVFKGEAEFYYPTEEPVISGYWPQQMVEKDRIFTIERQVEKAIKVIEQAKSPVIIAGNGIRISGAYEEFKELVEKIQTPVVSTLHGLAAFPQNDPLALGMIGMHGTDLANEAVRKADLIIAIGMRFDDRATTTASGLSGFAPNAKVIHIDIDPAEISKNVRADVAIVGDTKKVLQSLNSKIANQTHTEWLSQIEQWRSEYPASQIEESKQLLPEYCIRCLYDITGGETNIVTGVGQNQMWVALHFPFKKPNSFFSSGGLGAMGFGLPAGIGVQVARPGEPVWVIDGDGSFQMSMPELGTVTQERLPLKIAIINNGYLGMVRQWQELRYGRRYVATPLSGPDFVQIAKAYGIRALRVTKKEMVVEAIERAMEHPGPYLLDFRVEPEANVYPIVLLEVTSNSRLGVDDQKENISLTKKRVIVALVKSEPGVLEEVAILYRSRGFNLESVTVGPCEIEEFARMTIVVETADGGNEQKLEQARKQLEKLVSVVEAHDVTSKDFVGQEMVLIKVIHPQRRKLQERLDAIGAKIVRTTKGLVIVSVMGDVDTIEGFIKSLEESKFQIEEVVRSGLVALPIKIEDRSSGMFP